MSNRILRIEHNVQDRNSIAWQRLCEYVNKIEKENKDEFSPLEELGADLFAQIHTLPESIARLKKVKKVCLYGSKLKYLPPEIGQMEALEYFDPYTSYDLHWFPYEIIYCKNLKSSRVSTRALYGNYKNRMGFPSLEHNPVKYQGDTLCCSICRKEMTYDQTNQLWITLNVGTDALPLLANVCSLNCEYQLHQPAQGYIQCAHKGGRHVTLPDYEAWEEANVSTYMHDDLKKSYSPTDKDKTSKLLKLIRKIWR